MTAKADSKIPNGDHRAEGFGRKARRRGASCRFVGTAPTDNSGKIWQRSKPITTRRCGHRYVDRIGKCGSTGRCAPAPHPSPSTSGLQHISEPRRAADNVKEGTKFPDRDLGTPATSVAPPEFRLLPPGIVEFYKIAGLLAVDPIGTENNEAALALIFEGPASDEVPLSSLTAINTPPGCLAPT